MDGLSSHSHVHGHGKQVPCDETFNDCISTFPVERRKGQLCMKK